MKTKTVLLFAALLGAAAFARAQTATPQENWEKHCARCHAKDGSGDTKPGKKLNLKDYRSAEVQSHFTDEEILKVLAEGVTDDKGKKAMPDYSEKLTPEEREALVGYVRSLKTS